MSPRRNFWHDTAERAVLFNLGQDDIGQDASILLHDRRSGFVAGCLNA